MKKLFYFMALMLTTMGFTACSSNDDETPSVTINFEQAQYTLDGAIGSKVVITAKTSAPVAQATKVQAGIASVSLASTGSSASLVPYEMSSNYFDFAAGSSSASITITRKALATGSLSLQLVAANGIVVGKMGMTEIVFAGPNVYTFDKDVDVLADTREYKVSLETADGKDFSFASDTEIPLLVGAKSTAVEGVNYEFPNGKVAQFKAGKSEGTVTIKFLKFEEGKDKLLIQLDKTNLKAGNYSTLTVYVTGAPDFAGEWQLKEFVPNNLKYMSEQIGADIPVILDGTGSFKMETIDGGYQFTPSFTGKLVNYFTAAGKATYKGIRVEKWVDETGTVTMIAPKEITTYAFGIENVNYNVSPTDKTIKTALVEFHFQTTEAGEQQLIMSLIDYEPTEDTVAMGWGMTWKGVSDLMKYSEYTISPFDTAPIRIAFTRK